MINYAANINFGSLITRTNSRGEGVSPDTSL